MIKQLLLTVFIVNIGNCIRKKALAFSIALLLFSLSTNVWAGKIIYPWRSTTAIVKAGETFEVWYSADDGQTVNSIELQSPYIKVNATITNSISQTWIYDQWSGNTCNLKLTVSVPTNTPVDRYDLILKTSTGDEISLAGVKVIKEYKSSFYIFHISDAHRWQGSYDPTKILQSVSTTVDVANIIDPEMIIETGDNHYPNTNNVSSTIQRINDYMNGFINGTDFIKGMNHFSAPVFSVPGNHDTPQKNYQLEPDLKTPAAYFNQHYGLQAYNFTYGDARFIGLNNSWFSDESDGIPNFGHQTDAAKSWLNEVGKGNFRIGYCHVNTPNPLNAFYDPLALAGAPLNLIIVGHCHNSLIHTIKGYPDIKIAHSVYPLREPHRKAPFNLYKVNTVAGTYEPIGNEVGAHEGLEIADDYNSIKLKLTYSKANDGSNYDNEATIVNKYGFPITGAKIRFVLPKHSTYYITKGAISQEFDGTTYHIVDVSVDLEANSTTVVKLGAGIQPDLCPDDPNKMEPGICGCGVAEGTCEINVAGVELKPAIAKINVLVSRQFNAIITPANATNKSIIWTSSNSNVATVSPSGLVTAIAEGTTTITATSQDGSKTALSAVTIIPNSQTYQAEFAEFSGPVVAADQTGYMGDGFLDFINSSNDFIQWSVYVPTSDTYTLAFRYSLGTGNRPLKLSINGVEKISSMAFPLTGSWSTWGTSTTNQQLNAGTNTITLTAIGASGGNFDELTIRGGALGVNDFKLGLNEKNVNIYPNPIIQGSFSIDIIGFEKMNNVQVKIINLKGQTVYQKFLNNPTHLKIDTTGILEKSVYIISIESGQSKVVNRFIVN
ncbi:MAG: Ig-like domain-containing protein [Tenuifilaceae bacterium]